MKTEKNTKGNCGKTAPITQIDDSICLDCLDLHNTNPPPPHSCACHSGEETLPNLGKLINQNVQTVFYVREREGIKKLKGLKIGFEGGLVLFIKHKDDKLVVEIGWSL